jgi:hypothetical protein
MEHRQRLPSQKWQLSTASTRRFSQQMSYWLLAVAGPSLFDKGVTAKPPTPTIIEIKPVLDNELPLRT